MRLGCTGLKACSGGMGIFAQGCAECAFAVLSGVALAAWAGLWLWAEALIARKKGSAMAARCSFEFAELKEFKIEGPFISHRRRLFPSARKLAERAWIGLERQPALGVGQIQFVRWCGCSRRRFCWLRAGCRLC